MLQQLVGPLITLALVLLAFYLMLRPVPGMDSVFQSLGSALGHVVGGVMRFTFVGLAFLFFSATDAAITAGIATYQAVTGRPHLVPETWGAFMQRTNDRLHRSVLS